jgi:hypothetical protein
MVAAAGFASLLADYDVGAKPVRLGRRRKQIVL